MKPIAFLLAAVLALAAPQEGPRLRLEKGDSICLVGNTLADRMQHTGWLETLLQARFPDHELRIRNLGFSGDEVVTRLRSSGFGSPDQHLTREKADVVFAFFGYNESFAGEEGLPKFKAELAAYLKHLAGQKYNGKGAPRVAVLSPIAHEDLKDPNLPDGAANNARLRAYAKAMEEVAASHGAAYVDLFAPSAKLYAEGRGPLTLNGIHLNEKGDRLVAELADQGLFGPPPPRESTLLEKIREAVLDKNFHWYQRYRTTDGFSIFGGRGGLKFVGGQTNQDVAFRELEILDVMTSNRDRRIWAAAKGGELKVDDANTPDFLPVTTNKKGAGPDGQHLYLGAELAITKMEVAKGMKVELFASEEKFPELVNLVQMAFDPKGRLWVAAWPSYPHWKPKDRMDDKLLILEDTDGDGKADVCKTFAGGLHNPTGFEFWNGGVLLASAPELLFLKDTDGDDKADVRTQVLHGLDSADTHHQSNSFVLDPGGALYFQEGTFHQTQVESPYGPVRRVSNGAVFRYEPRTQRFDVYVSYGFANPHGHVFDRWGQDFVTDGTGAQTYFALGFSGSVDHPRKHPGMPTVYKQRTRPCPGTEILSSRHFPEAMQGNLIVPNVIGFQGLLQYKFHDEGSGFGATEAEVLAQSSDPNHRPSDAEIGPDGALYYTDWHNTIIGHMQHNLRDPSRNRHHGRVYRLRHLDRPLLKPEAVAGEPLPKLLDLLKSPDNRLRARVRAELSGRPTSDVIAAAKSWIAGLDKAEAEVEHHRLEGLWLHQSHNVVDEALLKQLLRSPDYRARAAATRVLKWWREKIQDPVGLLAVQIEDEHPRVRLEALNAASWIRSLASAGMALRVLKHPRDTYLDYVLKETMATLDPIWKDAVRKGDVAWAPEHPAVAEYLLGNVGTAELVRMPRTPSVRMAILTRPGVAIDDRREALKELAAERKSGETAVLLDLLEAAPGVEDLGKLLAERPDLAAHKDRMKALAEKGGTPAVRRVGYAAWAAAEGAIDAPWASAAASPAALLEAVPLLESKLREALFPKLRPLMAEKAASTSDSPGGRGVQVEYYEVAPRNVDVETLNNLKPKTVGIAREISLKVPQIGRRDEFALRFTASLAVPKDGSYTFFIASDDGSRVYLDGKLLINHDGLHGMDEKSAKIQLTKGPHALIVTYYDNGGGDGLDFAWQGPGFGKQPVPAAALGAEAADPVLDGLITAYGAIDGHGAERFADLSALVKAGKRAEAAAKAARKIERKQWSADPALAEAVAARAGALPVEERTRPDVAAALEFAKDVAALLPAEDAAKARARLSEVAVQVVVLRPIPHQMLFNLKKFQVEAGRPVEIRFENRDLMPHNLVITAPGAMAEVGQAAEAMGLQGQAKDYLPETPKILWATKLVLPNAEQTLRFTAPKEVGAYPYVCTFPGHWLIMNGTMEVVPVGTPTTQVAVEVREAAASSRAFVKMWATSDFEADVAKGLKGRNALKGRQVFNEAGCVKCHPMNGVGGKIAPELGKLTERFKGIEILRQVLEPSVVIHEQFKSWMIQTTSGDIVAGLIVKEDGAGLQVLTNPNDPVNGVTVVPTSKVQARKLTALSAMPAGLLTTFQKEEILDLAAFLESGGGCHEHEGR